MLILLKRCICTHSSLRSKEGVFDAANTGNTYITTACAVKAQREDMMARVMMVTYKYSQRGKVTVQKMLS